MAHDSMTIWSFLRLFPTARSYTKLVLADFKTKTKNHICPRQIRSLLFKISRNIDRTEKKYNNKSCEQFKKLKNGYFHFHVAFTDLRDMCTNRIQPQLAPPQTLSIPKLKFTMFITHPIICHTNLKSLKTFRIRLVVSSLLTVAKRARILIPM